MLCLPPSAWGQGQVSPPPQQGALQQGAVGQQPYYGPPSTPVAQPIPLPATGVVQGGYPSQQPGALQTPQVPLQQPANPSPPPVQPAAQEVAPPFNVSPQEQALVDQVLAYWESESSKIQNYQNTFTRHVYDKTFGPPPMRVADAQGNVRLQETALTISRGSLHFVKPDKGEFRIEEVYRFNADAGKYERQEESAQERWATDGQAIYEFNYGQKQMIVRSLPPSLQGKAIADGPLPFLFGAEAEKLKRRYYFRAKVEETRIVLEAAPRFQQDAVNYQLVELILDKRTCLPDAMRITHGGDKTTYDFDQEQAKVNSKIDSLVQLFKGLTDKPFGWTKIVEEIPEPTPAQGAPTAQQPASGGSAIRQ